MGILLFNVYKGSSLLCDGIIETEQMMQKFGQRKLL